MSLKRGDRVLYMGKLYYFVPLGTACKLFDNPELEGEPVHTPQKKSVIKASKKKGASKKTSSKPTPIVQEESSSESDSQDDINEIVGYRFFYVMVDLASTKRTVKAGITNSVRKRMRSYRTRVPDDFPVVVIDTKKDLDARAIEQLFKTAFAKERVANSEVFAITARTAEDYIVKQGYTRTDTGLFVKREATA